MNKKKALIKNLLSNITLFFLNGVIGFWLPPFLIKQLGVGTYGLIPLATTMIGYASLVTVGINGSLSRFLAIDLEKDDSEDANYTFNSAFTALSVILIILTPFLIYFSLNVSSFISLPDGAESDASIQFLCVSIAFIMTSFTAVFNTSAYVANRLDLVNRVSVINTFTRVLLVVCIYVFIAVSLKGYGFAVLVGSVIGSIYSYYLFRKYTPTIKINPSKFRWENLKSLLSMGGWLIVIQLGGILFLQIDLIVINKILGNVEAGKYSIVLQWSNMIRQFSLSLSGALGPLILTLYAKKEFDQMIKLSQLSNKVLTLFIACAVSVLIVISGYLLGIWIKPEFSAMKWLFIVVMVHLPINLGVQPLFSVNRAFNKVRVPGVMTCLMGLLNLILAICLVKYTNLKLYGVAISSAIVLTLKNFVFMPLYAARNMNVHWFTFFKSSLSSIVLVGIALVLFYVYPKVFTIESWTKLIFHSCALFAFFSVISFILLSKTERSMILSMVFKKK
ncbi:MATE family efflux transporter [Olivibacter ginsenosidimutans]|uniref:MATE family efflux transporter n=1 Tax=Olivibacter ginsenosidimutans TaxID=1176537 RepID=A0ABP9AS74_9SPHI